MHSILISTECVADLPKEILANSDLKIIYFDIETNRGLFRDTVEINSQNVMEYMVGGQKKAHSVVPNANEYKNYFSKHLKEYDEIIHISISTGCSVAYSNANLAKIKMGSDGRKIHLIDSKSLSGGQALLVLEAIKCRDEGMESYQLVDHLNDYKETIICSFLAYSADYLYYNGKTSKNIMSLCRVLNLHPVLKLVDGKLKLSKIYIGNYKKAACKYIKSMLGKVKNVNDEVAFLIQSGCDVELLDLVRKEINKRVSFKKLYENQASATISSNCGPYAFGILFVKEKN